MIGGPRETDIYVPGREGWSTFLLLIPHTDVGSDLLPFPLTTHSAVCTSPITLYRSPHTEKNIANRLPVTSDLFFLFIFLAPLPVISVHLNHSVAHSGPQRCVCPLLRFQHYTTDNLLKKAAL